MAKSSMKFQCVVKNDFPDENVSLCNSSNEDENVSANETSDFSITIKKESDPIKINKKEKTKLHKKSSDENEVCCSENQPKRKSKKKDKKSKNKNKNNKLAIKEPTFKIVLKKIVRKSKTKLKKDPTKTWKIKDINIKKDKKKTPNKIKTVEGCSNTLNENVASSSNDNKNHSKKTAKSSQMKTSKVTIRNKENKTPEVEDSKQNQNRIKIDNHKKKSSDVILKPNTKKIKLQVGKKCVAVPVSDENKMIETFQPKISKKSFKAKLFRNIPKITSTENQSIQLQVDDENHILNETDKTQESDETLMTSQPSIPESVNDGSTESTNKTNKHVLNKMRQRLFENFGKTLTYEELEEMCIQKMCEAIYHKSEIGELRYQLNEQEKMSKRLRMEVQHLSKQAESLKKLNELVLNQISALDATKKPLMQIKLVRSVGLQVQPSFFDDK